MNGVNGNGVYAALANGMTNGLSPTGIYANGIMPGNGQVNGMVGNGQMCLPVGGAVPNNGSGGPPPEKHIGNKNILFYNL